MEKNKSNSILSIIKDMVVRKSIARSASLNGLGSCSSTSIYGLLSKLGFLSKPIGAVSRNFSYAYDTLLRNEGSNIHEFDGYGDPIGYLAHQDLNSLTLPWYLEDFDKNSYDNYIKYMSGVYFSESNLTPNILSDNLKASLFDYNSLHLDNNNVGVVRSYDMSDRNAARLLIPSSQVNANGKQSDSRLGIINNFYLNATLNNAAEEYELRKGNNPARITKQVYDDFSLDGEFGIRNGEWHQIEGRVRTQKELLGDIIGWSTTDHNYDTSVVGGGGESNINYVQSVLSKYGNPDSNKLTTNFLDISKGTQRSNLYYPFGNFYSIDYSLGLLYATDTKTESFIAKSMFGYDLLSDEEVSFAYNPDDYLTSSSVANGAKQHPKKYYATNGSRGTNYIDMMTGEQTHQSYNYLGKHDINGIRIVLEDVGNDNTISKRRMYEYAEAEYKEGTSPIEEETKGNNGKTYNIGVEHNSSVVAYTSEKTSEKPDIINYTNQNFLNKRFDTLIGRFHTDEYQDENDARTSRDTLSSAISKYGMSHGRNLLRKDHKTTHRQLGEGYSNPYCRVWTYHHQYSTINNLIRPLDVNGDSLQTTDIGEGRPGQGNLEKYGVRKNNGFVRISPSNDSVDLSLDIKRCMFSIENLAVKHDMTQLGIEKGNEQYGPNGGRIMWFPPYDLKFSETSMANWSSNEFFGRGEKIHTYTNTEREGRLSFKLLVDHPSVINKWRSEINSNTIGDVDDVESNEQTILRFFAGCEILNGGTRKETIRKEDTEPNNKKEGRKTSENTDQEQTIEEATKTTGATICFYVFFPNNYSGVDDSAVGLVKPMWYLINGVGAQKYTEDENPQNSITNIMDLPTDMYSENPGYEVRINSNQGISLINTNKWEDAPIGEGWCRRYLGKSNEDISLATEEYKNKFGGMNYWAYRCDKVYANQNLHVPASDKNKTSYKKTKRNQMNYVDTTSYGLNGKGYEALINEHSEAQKYVESGNLYSFVDVFAALQSDSLERLNGDFNADKKDILKGLVETYDINSVRVAGMASSHGYSNLNSKLSKDRAESVMAWLRNCDYGVKFKNVHLTLDESEVQSNANSDNDENLLSAKMWRCARVIIELGKTETIAPSETETQDIDNINHFTNETMRQLTEAEQLVIKNSIKNLDEFKNKYLSEHGYNPNDMESKFVLNLLEQNNELAAKSITASKYGIVGNKLYSGYGDEYKFFSELKNGDPILHSKITEKIKYFDPAFHSITPEGFNARLTFLNQCTRQGSTSSSSDNTKIAQCCNLSFGAPPVCVLRIGDFYNTRVVIDSVSIDYGDTMWDLNDEGIGVQPMMADISIQFKFIGGSDLSGPIRRLQNAVSFNYYANTSVYDSRSDLYVEPTETYGEQPNSDNESEETIDAPKE